MVASLSPRAMSSLGSTRGHLAAQVVSRNGRRHTPFPWVAPRGFIPRAHHSGTCNPQQIFHDSTPIPRPWIPHPPSRKDAADCLEGPN